MTWGERPCLTCRIHVRTFHLQDAADVTYLSIEKEESVSIFDSGVLESVFILDGVFIHIAVDKIQLPRRGTFSYPPKVICWKFALQIFSRLFVLLDSGSCAHAGCLCLSFGLASAVKI